MLRVASARAVRLNIACTTLTYLTFPFTLPVELGLLGVNVAF